jgi:hydrogenase maturation protease
LHRSADEYLPVLVAGIGNILMRDDGVGVHVINELKKAPPPGALLVEIGVAPLRALHLLEKYDIVLAVDAMKAGKAPGTIYRMESISNIRQEKRNSLHELGLAASLNFISEDKRPEIFVLGVEPEIIEMGMNLSESVQAVLPELCNITRDMVKKLSRRSN